MTDRDPASAGAAEGGAGAPRRGSGLLGGIATVGGWTMASRVLGFVRDILIAGLLGTGAVAEAFFVAFRLPNMFRRFFAEGAFNMAFVPLFAKRLEGEGEGPARVFAEEAMAGLLAALILLTLVAQAAMPWFVLALASGFSDDPARFEMAVLFSRICFPYIVFISLAALFSGILNAFGRFAAAAAAPVLLNVILCAALGLAWGLGLDRGLTLSAGVFAAGAAQLWLVVAAARRRGMGLRLRRPRLTPDMRRLVGIGIPAALAGGVLQINLVVGTQVASYTEGAVAWLWLADRVYQLPLGLIGVAIGVVLLPVLSRQVRAGETAAARHTTNRAGEVALALTLPATAALLAMPGLITEVLFERGAFGPEDTAATALALAVYAAGLPAFVLQKVVQPVYFAREDTATPLRYALVGMAVNAAVAIGLMPVIGYLAAALAAVLAAWVNLWLLWRGAARRGADLTPDARLAHAWPRILAASALSGAIVWGLDTGLAERLPALPRLGLLIAVGAGSYAGLALALGAFDPRALRALIKGRDAPQ